ncbi:MAG: dipeptide/oligopeptide/nickel ABC transporter ATP-binding protein [Clostridia bacterium]|jgi:peptide/nickel transport system ATP-binding protein|nr:dipeptide/oligopeptide/nickel ABC transporter ATP-binding protein [Clostridia bacterium]
MLLVLEGITRSFVSGRQRVPVLRGADLSVGRGEVVALVGASGAGKTTLLMIVAGLLAADSGRAFFDGRPLPLRETRSGREEMSLVFQDPYAALSPHFHVRDLVAEPLILRRIPAGRAREEAAAALEAVGLAPVEEYLGRHPHELSGGQRQRVALARALVTRPQLLLADEPTSMLDASVGVDILNLLRRVADRGTAVLLTAHDPAAAAYLADRLAVMAGGRIVEEGPPERLLTAPATEATRQLLAAAG